MANSTLNPNQKRPPSGDGPEYDRDKEAVQHSDAHTHERVNVDTQDAPSKKNVNASSVLAGLGAVAVVAVIWLIAIFLRV